MAVFSYKGISRTGSEVKDKVTADGLPQAKQKLKSMGIMITQISEEKSKGPQKQAGFGPQLSIMGSKNVNVRDLALMTRQMAILLKAKIPLVQALEALVDQTEHPYVKIVLGEVKQKVNEGSSLAKAMSDYPRLFDHIYINMVEAGESSGTLSIVLIRLAEFTEAQVKLRAKIKSAMTYPIIMATIGLIMMLIIFTVVIPKITKIFISMKKELPLPTKMAIAISGFIINYWYVMIIGAIAFVVLMKKYLATEAGRSRFDAIVLKLPVVGELSMMINVSRFCATLSTLMTSGVPILASMNIVKNLISNVHMQKAVMDSRESISEGASMVVPLVKSGLFPPMVTHMMKLGEKSGEVENMLEVIATNYEEQVENKLSGLTSILEPIMMVGMGIAVGFIVFAVVMPLLQLNQLRH